MNTTLLVFAVNAALLAANTALADNPATMPDAASDANIAAGAADLGANPPTLKSVEVNAKLDRSRNQLSPDIGASQYVIDQAAIERLPLGEATPLNQVLLQAPGVVQDSFGQLHVRDDHADLQYRINGVIIPESISGFGQSLDTDIIERIQLLTGALPAQYGYRTAGVVDITTESGAHRHGENTGEDDFGGKIGVAAGSHGTLNPEISLHGSSDRWSYFFTGDYLQNDVGIENPTAERNEIHDHTNQVKGFGYLSYLIDENTRAGFMFGLTENRFQIPDTQALSRFTHSLASTVSIRASSMNVSAKSRVSACFRCRASSAPPNIRLRSASATRA